MEVQEHLNDNEVVDSLQPEPIRAPIVQEAMANGQEAPEVADPVMVEQPAEETMEPTATENGSGGKKKRPSPKKLGEAKKGPKKSEKPEQKAKVDSDS